MAFTRFILLISICLGVISFVVDAKNLRKMMSISDVDTSTLSPYFFINEKGQLYQQFSKATAITQKKSSKKSVAKKSAKKSSHHSRKLADPTKTPTEAMTITGWLLYDIYGPDDHSCSANSQADAAIAVGVCLTNSAESDSVLLTTDFATDEKTGAVTVSIVTHSFSDSDCTDETGVTVEEVELSSCHLADISENSPYSGSHNVKLTYSEGRDAPLLAWEHSGVKTTFVADSGCDIANVVEQSTISPDFCLQVDDYDDVLSAKVLCDADNNVQYNFYSDAACADILDSFSVGETVCSDNLEDFPYGDYYNKYYKQTCK